MTTLNDLLASTARDLNDYTEGVPNKQFQRWSKRQLTGYWNEAFCNMFTLNPSKFKRAVTEKLKPGSHQKFDCSKVLSVIGVSDKDGNVLYEIDTDFVDHKLRWGVSGRKKCTPFQHSRDYKVERYRIESEKDGSVFVYPPVPYGVERYLTFMCEKSPVALDLSKPNAKLDLEDCTLQSIGIEWVLFRALMVDEESASSTNLATAHLNLFFKLLESKVKIEELSNYGLQGVPDGIRRYLERQQAERFYD